MTPSTLLSILPNLITLARLLAVPLMIFALLEQSFVFAFWLFLAAGISDALDGLIAKQFGAVTEIGAYLDPIADKALLVSVYVTLGHLGVIDPWLVILIVSRDLMIVGGAILFARNVESPSQVRRLVADLHAAAPDDAPLTVAIDQEGGRVQRLRAPWTEWPPMRRLGEAGRPDDTRAVGRALGRELRNEGERAKLLRRVPCRPAWRSRDRHRLR